MVATDGEKLQQLDLQLNQILPSLETSQTHQQQQQSALEEAEQQMQEWQESWDQFRREFHQVHESAQIENRGIEHIERQVHHTDQQRSRLQHELDALDTTDMVAEIDELEDQVEARTEEHASTMALTQTGADDIQQLRLNCENLSTELDQNRNLLQTASGRLSSLEALQQNLLHETSDDVRQWLDKNSISSRRRLTGLLKVKGNAEKAVEVVLSPFLGAYCVEPGGTIPNVMVANQNIVLFDDSLVKTIATERDWPKLSDLVECEIDLTALLDGIYLCQDMDELRYKRSQLQAGESLVLRQGLWAGRNWVLQLGEEDHHSGMIAREREIEQLRQQQQQANQAVMTFKSQYDGELKRLQDLEQRWN